MKFGKAAIPVGILLAIVTASGAVTANPRHYAAIPIGWSDEMNDPATWEQYKNGSEVDKFSERPGALTLRLPHVAEGYPYTYQWGGITRRASDDLGRYPILVAYISRVHDGSYAHLELEESDYSGKPVRTLRGSTLQGRGLSVVDVGGQWGNDTRRFTVRLIVGGANAGASCEYAWVRFVRREDLPKLQANPNADIVLKP